MQGSLLFAVSGPARALLVHAKDGRQCRCSEADAGGPGDAGIGSADDSSVFAAGAGTLGTQLLHLARATAPGVETARDQDSGSGQRISLRALCRRIQPQVSGSGAAAWYRLHALPAQKP